MDETLDLDEDFPAAHSMDTRWYAIDRDGYLAEFITSENGVLPEVSSGEVDLVSELIRDPGVNCDIDDIIARPPNITMKNVENLLDKCAQPISVKPYYSSYGPGQILQSQTYTITTEEDGILELSLTETVTGDRTTNIYEIVVSVAPKFLAQNTKWTRLRTDSTDHQLVLIGTTTLTELHALLETGEILHGWNHCYLDVDRLGVFSYDSEDKVRGNRYLLEKRTNAPVHISQLQPALQQLFSAINFPDVSFCRGDEVWPRRYYRCRGWYGG